MELYGWGRYPRIQASMSFPQTLAEFGKAISDEGSSIARGLGRSYGDASLAPQIINVGGLNRFISFDEYTGVLKCDAGVSLVEILSVFVPRGWFLPVTPGTKFVTVAGAIASDVHGKNHHLDGTFSQYVREITMLLGSGERLTVSPTQKSDLYRATCGGMGLTGVIVNATLKLKPIQSSQIVETTIKVPDLDAVLEAFEDNLSSTYSVAWIDCLAKGKDLGRSLLMLGEHAETGALYVNDHASKSIPIDMPAGLLNPATVRLFNTLYYQRIRHKEQTRTIHYEPFFYPLDKLSNWNRLYGKPGFTQYQFVLPKETARDGMRTILERIATSGRGSFLAVLKGFGQENQNLLSFPMAGYTLALDFKVEPAVLALLNDLDKLVLDYGGRLYLTKDARMSESTFKASYPNWQQFEDVRGRYHAIGKFASMQSKRLGLQ